MSNGLVSSESPSKLARASRRQWGQASPESAGIKIKPCSMAGGFSNESISWYSEKSPNDRAQFTAEAAL